MNNVKLPGGMQIKMLPSITIIISITIITTIAITPNVNSIVLLQLRICIL